MPRMKVCVVSGSRAEFGQLIPLLERFSNDPFFDLALVLTGSHLDPSIGSIAEVSASGIPVSDEMPIPSLANNTRSGVARQISEVIDSFRIYFERVTSDIVVLIGDRYEMFGVAVAAYVLNIPIAHICGGSTSGGSLDEGFRHSITKMASLHFTTCETYRKRVIQLGENPSTVFNVGSLALENCLKTELLNEEEIRKTLNLPSDCLYAVVTFHPETSVQGDIQKEMTELLKGLTAFPFIHYVVTMANADSGGEVINELWINAGEKHENIHVFSSLGTKKYLSALKYSGMMIGNSSSGTTEGPAMGVPVINIGDRQKGRLFSEATIHCPIDSSAIINAINVAKSDSFKMKAAKFSSPFGKGDTSLRIVKILKDYCSGQLRNNANVFYDVDFEVKE